MSAGGQGTVRYALMFDTAQAESGVKRFQTTLQQLQQVNANTSRQIQTFNASISKQSAAFTAGINPIKQQGSALQNLSKNIQANNTQFTTIGTKIKDTASKFAGFATGLSATASGVLQLGAGFRDYNDAQIAVERVTRKVSLAHEALGKATDKLTKLQHSGKASSKELAQAQLDVKQAQEQLNIQTQLLGESQERMFDSQTQFATAVIPTALGAIGTLGSAFKDLGLNGSKLKGMFESVGGLAVGLKGKLLGIGLDAAGIGLVTDAAIQMADGINKAVMSFDKLAKPVSVLEVLTDKSGKRLGQFNTNLKETEILTKAGVTPAMLALDELFKTHLVEDTLRNAGALDEYNQVIHNTSKWVPLGTKAVSDLGASFTRLKGPVAATQKDLNMLAPTTKPLNPIFDQIDAKLIEFNLQWGMAHGVIPRGAADIQKATQSLENLGIAITKGSAKMSVGLGVAGGAAVDFGDNVKNAIGQLNERKLQDFGSGLDKVIKAFERFHKGKLPEFEIKFDKAKKEFDRFESEFGEKLGKMGPAGQKAAKDYVERFVKEGVPKMPKAAQDMMKPIIVYAQQHKNDPPGAFVDGFITVLGKAKQNIETSAKKNLAGPLTSSMKSAVTSIKGDTKEIQGFINNLHGTTIPIKLKISTEGGTGVGGNINANIRLGQHGLHEWVNKPTLFMAGEGGENERVDITPASKMPSRGGGGGGNNNTIIENHVHILDENIMRRFTARQSRNRYVFGA